MQVDLLCSDEVLLRPDPHPSCAAWFRERVAYGERESRSLRGAHVRGFAAHLRLMFDAAEVADAH